MYGHLVHKDEDGQPIKAAKHHRLWVELAHKVESGEIRRLLIIAPPGGAKSTWWSLTFVPWYLGRHPEQSILAITSSDSQAKKFAGVVSDVLAESEQHAAIFPEGKCRPHPKRPWSIESGYFLQGMRMSSKDPSYQMVGRTSKVIGNRCIGIVLDDLLDEKESRSDTVLQDTKDDIDNTFETRLHPTRGWMVAVMTSWNERDIAHFLANKPTWTVVHMPALGDPDIKPISQRATFCALEPGESFWPKRFPASFLEEVRRDPDRGGAKFSAIYQGDPTAMGGDFFKDSKWFRPLPDNFDTPSMVRLPEGRVDVRTPRERLRVLTWWDLNYSDNPMSDWTVGLTLGVDVSRNVYILGVFRDHCLPHQAVEAIVQQWEIFQPHLIGVEEAAFRSKTTQDIVRTARRQVICNIALGKATGEKEDRAMLPAGRAAAGMVFADINAPWWPTFLQECLAFNKGLHDDQVDAFSGATAMAAEKMQYVQEGTVTRQKYTMKRSAA